MKVIRRRPMAVAGLTLAVLAAHLGLLARLAPDRPAPLRTAPQTWQVRLAPPVTGPAEAPRPPAPGPATPPADPAPGAMRPPPPTRPIPQSPQTPTTAAPPTPRPLASARPDHAPASAAPAAGPALRLALPASRRLHYTLEGALRGQPVTGRAELDWRHDGTRYEARLVLALPAGRRRQDSRGEVGPAGLAPERHAEEAGTGEAVHFDRAGGRITFSRHRPEVPLQDGAQDRLSVLLQLGALLAGEPSLRQPGRRIALQTATTREAETWQWQVAGEEEPPQAGGHPRAWRLDRLPRHPFDPGWQAWFAPALDYLPVRLRLTWPSGDWLDQQWTASDRN